MRPDELPTVDATPQTLAELQSRMMDATAAIPQAHPEPTVTMPFGGLDRTRAMGPREVYPPVIVPSWPRTVFPPPPRERSHAVLILERALLPGVALACFIVSFVLAARAFLERERVAEASSMTAMATSSPEQADPFPQASPTVALTPPPAAPIAVAEPSPPPVATDTSSVTSEPSPAPTTKAPSRARAQRKPRHP